MDNLQQAHQIVLKRPTEFEPSRRPTVSLSLTVRPGDERAGSLLDSVGPWVDEIVVVAVDLPSSAVDALKSHPVIGGKNHAVTEVSLRSHPYFYARDAAETFAAGSSLAGEVYSGRCSGGYFVSDWSAIRNLGWSRCSCEWRLALDGNDVLLNPAYVASVCDVLDGHQRELGYLSCSRPARAAPTRAATSSLVGRLGKNGSPVRWEGVAAETLEGSSKTAVVEGSLATVKSAGASTALEESDLFKVLYASARRRSWDVPPCDLLHMARTARFAGMPDFAEVAIRTYLESSLYTEERAWACAIRGELLEEREDYAGASTWYERSLAEHPGRKSAFRLCRSRFLEGRWQAALDAFEVGRTSSFVHFVDDGKESGDESLILAAVALEKLGRVDEARKYGDVLRTLFSNNESVLRLCDHLGC